MEEFDKLLTQVRDKYEQVCSQCDRLQKRIVEFNADKEIQKAHREVQEVEKAHRKCAEA